MSARTCTSISSGLLFAAAGVNGLGKSHADELVAVRGGNLGGLGDGSPKFEVGDGPCIRPPNILRSSVVGCA